MADKKKVAKKHVVEGEAIDLREKTVVFASHSNPYHETGSEIRVHPKTAEYLVKQRRAFETKEEADASFEEETEPTE